MFRRWLVNSYKVWWAAARSIVRMFFRGLTDDVEILLEVKQRDAAGVQAFPCQLQLQFLLQGWVRAHGIDPHHEAVLLRTTTTLQRRASLSANDDIRK